LANGAKEGIPLSRESSQVVHRFLQRTAGERRALPAFWRLESDEVRLNGFSEPFDRACKFNVVLRSEGE
jgi:hypothetical protein